MWGENLEEATWLASLSDRFEIIFIFVDNVESFTYYDNYNTENHSQDDYDDDSYNENYDVEEDEFIEENELFDIILENKNHAYELLGISDTFYNKENEICLICRENTNNLLQLNCRHYGCLECLSIWYKNNKEICPYCKKDIIWNQCKRLN